MNNFKQKFSLLTFMITSMLSAYDKPFIDHVINNHLNTYGALQNKPQKQSPKEKSWKDAFKPKRFQTEIKKYSARELAELAFKAAPIIPSLDAVIDTNYIDKMEIVRGAEQEKNNLITLLCCGNFTQSNPYIVTQDGIRELVNLTSQPINQLDELLSRQKIIKEFVINNELRTSIASKCAVMKKNEDVMLSFHDAEDPLSDEIYKEVYLPSMFSRLNNNSIALEGMVRTRNLLTAANLLDIPILTFTYHSAVHFFVRKALADSTRIPPISVFQACKIGARTTRELFTKLPKAINKGVAIVNELPFPIKAIIYAYCSALTGFYVYGKYLAVMNFKFKNDIAKHLQFKMIATANYLRGIKETYQLIESNPHLAPKIQGIEHLRNLVAPDGSKSEKFNELVNLLSKDTFTHNPSFFSLTGRVLAAHKLMREIKEEFAHVRRIFGQIEVLNGIAQLMTNAQHDKNSYCFVEFVNQQQPSIKAVEFWNPYVDTRCAVANTLELGANAGNMILTGPNTGGKSTLIKGLMISLHMAQIFGVAPAQQLTMTPFTHLTCHLNINDNTAAGISLFKAEVLRAKELMNMVKKLKPHEYAFIIIDEIFTGTAPEKAQELAYDFIKQLSSNEQCIFINATHFKKLTSLENEISNCKNYQMETIINTQGKVTKYTYKVIPGASTISNAQQIVTEEQVTW